MTATLPFTPPPLPDELMSSWIERIGIFYGVGYERALAVVFPNDWVSHYASNEDIDADRRIRDALCAWTGRNIDEIPPLVDGESREILDVSARLTYCPACWDDDVAGGGQPYLRRRWILWTSVCCDVHEVWLNARRPRVKVESRTNGWSEIWRSHPQWARATDQRYDASFEGIAATFDARTIDRPVGHWRAFMREVTLALGGAQDVLQNPFEKSPLLAEVASAEFTALRRDVRAALELREPTLRIDELDLKGNIRAEPAWIANRIACVAIAVELARLAARRKPIFPRVRPAVESAACARAGLSRLSYGSRRKEAQSHSC